MIYIGLCSLQGARHFCCSYSHFYCNKPQVYFFLLVTYISICYQKIYRKVTKSIKQKIRTLRTAFRDSYLPTVGINCRLSIKIRFFHWCKLAQLHPNKLGHGFDSQLMIQPVTVSEVGFCSPEQRLCGMPPSKKLQVSVHSKHSFTPHLLRCFSSPEFSKRLLCLQRKGKNPSKAAANLEGGKGHPLFKAHKAQRNLSSVGQWTCGRGVIF